MRGRASARPYVIVFILCALLWQIMSPVTVLAQPPRQETSFDTERIERATVLITQVYTNPLDQTVISCIGSGTLVSIDGLILTNAHVALPVAGCRSDRLVIALTRRIGEAPVATYYAQPVAWNLGWDLAVVQITGSLDDRPVDRENLSLPFVELGISEDIQLDNTISIAGYAAQEGQERNASANAVSRIIRGTVSGFTAEGHIGDRAWIKTRAVLPGTMTGGGAYSAEGKLVGIPTVEPATSNTSGDDTTDCRRIQDSNGDGRVDSNDLCVPVSGLINAIRPARLARGLILAARLGISPEVQPATQPEPSTGGKPTFSRLLFAPGVDPAGMPTSVVISMPTGVTQLYLFFDYDNMTDGMIYELRTTRDSLPDPVFSLAPTTWSGGRRGLWYIGSTAQQWPNGNYEFTLFIEGERAASSRIVIGGPARQDAVFTNLLFGVLNDKGELVSTGNAVPVSSLLYAEFIYNNMVSGLAWKQVWYYEQLKISESTEIWAGPNNGKQQVSASAGPDQALQPGRYRLELYVGETMAATSDFLMIGGQEAYSTQIFTNLTFASELKDNQPVSVGNTFANTINSLYGLFDWREIAAGTPWTWRWSVDDNLLFEVSQPWTHDITGTVTWLHLKAQSQIPDGTYKLELVVAGVVRATATARVGLGQLPVSIFTVTEGVQVQGQIVDAETGRGIPGVSFIVLKPAYDVRDFTWQMTEVLTMALTDAEGYFSLTTPLPRDEIYSALVIAQGYLPTSTDALEIKPETTSPVELRIELNRD